MAAILKKIGTRLYEQSPVFLQNFLLSEEGRRYRHQRFGRDFEELKKLWGETQWFSRPELENFQNERLESLVRTPTKRSPIIGQ